MKKLLLIPLLFIQNLGAQAQPGEEIPGFLRVLAVGETPTWKTRKEGNRRVQIPPPPGAIPPQRLSFSGAVDGAEGIAFGLNRMTDWVTVADNTLPVQISELKAGQNGAGNVMKNWAKAPAPKIPLFSVLTKDLTNDKFTWDNPKRYDFSDSLKAFPNESIRIINLTGNRLAVKIGEGAPKGVDPFKHKVFTATDGVVVNATFLDIRRIVGKEYRKLKAKDVGLLPNHRMTFVVHMGDRPKTKTEVKVREFINPSRVPTPQ